MKAGEANAPDWLMARPIAHRGLHDFSRGLPENSLGAARAALSQGYGVECDLRLSRDGKVFVFHDETLGRLCGKSGAFDAHEFGELLKTPLLGSNECVASLQQLLGLVQGARPLILELKSDFSGNVALAIAVAAALGDYAGPAAIKSFDPALIAALRATDAPWPLGIISQSDHDEPEWAELSYRQIDELARFTHARATRPDFLSWRARDLPNPTCEFARACAGRPVMTWTIRSPEQAASARRHADQIVFEGFLA